MDTTSSRAAASLNRYRWSLGLFIVGLVLSGVTAFPLLSELSWLCDRLGIADSSRFAELEDRQVGDPPHGGQTLDRGKLLLARRNAPSQNEACIFKPSRRHEPFSRRRDRPFRVHG